MKARFAELMAALGPFESRPKLAVAVSGGADSMALTLLAAEWAREIGGEIIALTVDHGLRAASADEARQVAAWLAPRGIAHHSLLWQDSRDGPDLQAAARRARYALLTEWCREHHVLHLLTAHHQDDQAETLLLRLGRGSGVDGLSAMAPANFHDGLQLLRPLLSVPSGALRGYLREQRQDWIEDPSNRSDRFERVRWRKIMAAQKIPAARLALTAAQMGRARQALESETAALAVEAVRLHDAGFAWLDVAILRSAPLEVALRLLASVTRTIGGQEFPPRLDGLERLLADLARRRSFSGCILAPQQGKVLIYREARGVAPPVALRAGEWVRWDNRHSAWLTEPGEYWLGALGQEGAKIKKTAEIPRILLPTLPAIMDKRGILAVPPLGYSVAWPEPPVAKWGFTPAYPLVGAGFRLVTASARTMY